jgi:hypothetical protein
VTLPDGRTGYRYPDSTVRDAQGEIITAANPEPVAMPVHSYRHLADEHLIAAMFPLSTDRKSE